LYALAEKKNAGRVILFETYTDSAQYKAHLATSHFQKYKQGTLQMVKHLELIEMQSILYHRKPQLSRSEAVYIRLIKMTIDISAAADFNKLANTVMLPGIKEEQGVLLMYAVSEKNHPARISILEVYENSEAYKNHIETPHFLKYKEQSANIVTSLEFIDVNPILLGSKPQ
jgi:quinol monooxygenase YgiN